MVKEINIHGYVAAVLIFANSPLRQATRAVVGDLKWNQVRHLRGFLREFDCSEALCDLTLSEWNERVRVRKDWVSVAHSTLECSWTNGLNQALRAICAPDFK